MTADGGQKPETSRASRLLWAALKTAVSAALLVIIARKVPVRGALDGVLSLSPAAILVIVVLTFAFPAVAAIRWRRALLRLGSAAQWSDLFLDTLVASTYNMLLPTSIGGDVVRAWRCSRRVATAHHAWSSTIFERLIGIVALALLAVPGIMRAPGRVREIGVAIGFVAIVSATLVLFAHAPIRWMAGLLASRAPKMAGAGDRIASDLSGPLAAISVRIEMMAWSMLYQMVGLGVLVVAVVDWGMPAVAWAVLGAVPLALILTLLPITIAGLGLRESLFVVLLGRFGLSADRSLSLALVWLGSALLLAMAGAVVMAVQAWGAGQAAQSTGKAAPNLPPPGPKVGPEGESATSKP